MEQIRILRSLRIYKMFCTSLRRRPSFASAVPVLTKGTLPLRGWCIIHIEARCLTVKVETQLETHDLEVPLQSQTDARTGHTISTRQLRALLLSRSAVADEKLRATFERIEHFASLTGGEDLVFIFLLNPPPASTFVSAKDLSEANNNDMADTDAIAAYSKLQAELINHADIPHIPVLPILTVANLSETISKHTTALQSQPPKQRAPATSSFSLLKLCTANPPMSEQTAYVLSDLFKDLKDLAFACSTVSSAPNSSSPSARAAGFPSSFSYDINTQSSDSNAASRLKRLRDLIGEQECHDIIDFWKEEWTLP